MFELLPQFFGKKCSYRRLLKMCDSWSIVVLCESESRLHTRRVEIDGVRNYILDHTARQDNVEHEIDHLLTFTTSKTHGAFIVIKFLLLRYFLTNYSSKVEIQQLLEKKCRGSMTISRSYTSSSRCEKRKNCSNYHPCCDWFDSPSNWSMALSMPAIFEL